MSGAGVVWRRLWRWNRRRVVVGVGGPGWAISMVNKHALSRIQVEGWVVDTYARRLVESVLEPDSDANSRWHDFWDASDQLHEALAQKPEPADLEYLMRSQRHRWTQLLAQLPREVEMTRSEAQELVRQLTRILEDG